MPVQIVDHSFANQDPVDFDVIVATVEKNRDRVRTVAGMLLSLAGVLMSFSSGFVLFVSDKAPREYRTIGLFVATVLFFLISAVLAISSSFLRSKYAVADKAQFTTDLLQLYSSELRLLRIASVTTTIGLLLVVAGVGSFIVQRS